MQIENKKETKNKKQKQEKSKKVGIITSLSGQQNTYKLIECVDCNAIGREHHFNITLRKKDEKKIILEQTTKNILFCKFVSALNLGLNGILLVCAWLSRKFHVK